MTPPGTSSQLARSAEVPLQNPTSGRQPVGHLVLGGPKGRLVAADEVAKKLVGLSYETDTESVFTALLHEAPAEQAYRELWIELRDHASRAGDESPSKEVRLVRQDNAGVSEELCLSMTALITATFLKDSSGECPAPDHLILVTVSPAGPPWPQRVDPLTSLADRSTLAAFWETLASGPCAVLFLDLNDFKQANDQYGHAAGDTILRQLAHRWQDCVRDRDLLVRYGGDEFIVVLPSISNSLDAQPVEQRLRDAAAKPVDHHGVSLSVSAAVGIAIGNPNEESLESIVAQADRAMYASKRQPK